MRIPDLFILNLLIIIFLVLKSLTHLLLIRIFIRFLKPNSNEYYVVGADMGTLQGVYNVNKGYAVFKQIEILYQNNDYSIIKTGTSYGISMYDHIVLQGDEVEENTIINN